MNWREIETTLQIDCQLFLIKKDPMLLYGTTTYFLLRRTSSAIGY